METGKTKTHLSPLLRSGFYAALGHTIKVARTDLGVDRKDLAERAGISYSYLAAIESGKKQPSSQVLLALAEALGLRTHELLESAEGRRERNLSPTEEYPRWLLGRSVVTRHASVAPTAGDTRPPEAETEHQDIFVAEMRRLGVSMSDSDKQLLLDMARKLAGQG